MYLFVTNNILVSQFVGIFLTLTGTCVIILFIYGISENIREKEVQKKAERYNTQISGILYKLLFPYDNSPLKNNQRVILSIKGDSFSIYQESKNHITIPVNTICDMCFYKAKNVFNKTRCSIGRLDHSYIVNTIENISGIRNLWSEYYDWYLCLVEFHYPNHGLVTYAILIKDATDVFYETYKKLKANHRKSDSNNAIHTVQIITIGFFSGKREVGFDMKSENVIITGNKHYLMFTKQQRKHLVELLNKILEWDSKAREVKLMVNEKFIDCLQCILFYDGRYLENIKHSVSFSCDYNSDGKKSFVKINIPNIHIETQVLKNECMNIKEDIIFLDMEDINQLLNIISDETINNAVENKKMQDIYIENQKKLADELLN
jgi:hypothetical protein